MGVGLAHCAPAAHYPMTILAVTPFVMIPIAIGTGRHAAPRQHLSGAPRARHPDADGAAVRRQPRAAAAHDPARAAAARRVAARHHRFLRHAAVAGDAAAAVVLGRGDGLRRAAGTASITLHVAALWTTALAVIVIVARSCERWHFTGFSKAQEGRKVRFTRLALLDRVARVLPISTVHRHLLVKDLEAVPARREPVVAAAAAARRWCCVYLYNFRVLDLDRIPYMSGMVKNVYAFVNLAMAGLVMSTVCAALRVSGGVGGRGARSGSSAPRRSRCAPSCGRSSGPACCRSSC